MSGEEGQPRVFMQDASQMSTVLIMSFVQALCDDEPTSSVQCMTACRTGMAEHMFCSCMSKH